MRGVYLERGFSMCGRPSPLNFQVSFRWRLRSLASVQTNHPDVLMVPSSALILAICQQSGTPKDPWFDKLLLSTWQLQQSLLSSTRMFFLADPHVFVHKSWLSVLPCLSKLPRTKSEERHLTIVQAGKSSCS